MSEKDSPAVGVSCGEIVTVGGVTKGKKEVITPVTMHDKRNLFSYNTYKHIVLIRIMLLCNRIIYTYMPSVPLKLCRMHF